MGEVDALHDRYGVSVSAADERRYRPGSDDPAFEPFRARVLAARASGGRLGFVLADPPPERVLFRDGPWKVIAWPALTGALSRSPAARSSMLVDGSLRMLRRGHASPREGVRMRLLLGSGGLSTEERRRAWRDQLDEFLGAGVARAVRAVGARGPRQVRAW